MSINSVENSNNTNETNETQNQNRTQNINYDSHINDFISSKYLNLKYFDNLKNSKIEADFIKFLTEKEIPISSPLDPEIKNKLNSKYLSKRAEISSKRNYVFESIFEEYSIDKQLFSKNNDSNKKLKDDIESELIKNINNLGYFELLNLYKSSYSIKAFIKNNPILKDISKNLVEIKKDDLFVEIFGNLKLDNILLNSKAKDRLLSGLENLSKINKQIMPSDMEEIVNLLSPKGIFLFIKYFKPILTLQEAIDLKIISSKELEETKTKAISKLYKDFDSKNDEEKAEIISLIDNDSVYVRFDDINKNSFNKIEVDQDFLMKIIKNENDEKINQLLNQINTLKDFKKKVKFSFLISKDIKTEIEKLETNSILKCNYGKDSNIYYYFNDLSNGKISLSNITFGTRIYGNSIDGNIEDLSLNDFYDLLENISKSSTILTVYENIDKLKESGDKSEVIENLGEINDIEKFESILNEKDPEGSKLKLRETAFELKNPKNNKTAKCYVKGLNGNEITLNTGEKFTFGEFIQFIKNLEIKREKQFGDFQELFEFFTKNNPKLSKYIFKDGKIFLEKDKDKKENDSFDFMVFGKYAIKINNIDDKGVDFEFGEYKEGNLLKGKDSEFKKIEYGESRVFNFFEFKEYLISKNDESLNFDLKKETEVIENNPEEDNRKGSLMKKWFSLGSIAELSMSFKHLSGSIESYLKTGNSLKSAKLASAMGKYLPKAVQDELQYKLQSEEKKSMETIVSNLKTKNTSEMIAGITAIIKNKNSESYEVEAALMTMVSKFGTLYSKGLNPERDNFLWYVALGGKKGDAFYEQVKKECEMSALEMAGDKKSQPVTFCEEYLVEKLLSEQVKIKSSFYPKRRDKFDKDYGKYLNNGISEELEDGKNKTSGMVTFNGRLNYAIGEFIGGGYANGVGAMKNVWGKAGNSMQFNAIPFILTYSGICNNVPQKLLAEICGPGHGWNTPFTMLMFNKDPEYIKLYQKVVEDTVKTFDNSDMTKALEGCNGGKNIKKVKDFWFKYGKELNDRLTFKDGFLFAGIKSKEARQKLIDKNIDVKSIEDYYDFTKGIQSDSDFSMDNEYINTDKLKGEDGTYVMLTSAKKLIKGKLKFTPSGFPKEGNKVFGLAMETLNLLKDPNGRYKDLDLDSKKAIFKEIYTLIHASFTTGNDYYRALESTEARQLKASGLDIFKYPLDNLEKYPGDMDTDDYMGYTKAPEFKNFIDNLADKFLDNKNIISEININKSKVDSILDLKNVA